MKGFGGGGLQQLMRQANQMQMKMKKLQEELAQQLFEGSSGGGAVLVKVSGDNRVNSITIKPEVVTGGDVEMLQDLILTATNVATSECELDIGLSMGQA